MTAAQHKTQLAGYGVTVDELDALVELEAAVQAAVSTYSDPPDTLDLLFQAGTLNGKNAAAALAASVRAAQKPAAQSAAGWVLGHIDRRAAALLLANADAIVEGLRPAFDSAVADLAGTVHQVGGNPPASVANISPAAAENFHAQKAIVAGLRGIESFRHAVDRGPRDASWYIDQAATQPDLDRARRAFGQAGLGGLIEAGFELRLNTPTEAAAIVVQAAEASAQAEAKLRDNDPREQARRRKAQREVDAWART